MELSDAIKELKNSLEFKRWHSKAENKDSYLTHALITASGPDFVDPSEFQFGFYSVDRDTVTTFLVRPLSATLADSSNLKVVQGEETEALKPQGATIAPLDVNSVILDFSKAVSIAKNEIELESAKISNSILVLQNLTEFGQVWNITFVLNYNYLLNVKIDSESGQIKDKISTPLSRMMNEYK